LTFILKIIFGLFAGFLSGFYGVGGGIVFVPVLLFFLMAQGYDSNVGMLLATGTSLGAIVLSSGSSTSRHIHFRNVKFETAILITIGVVLSSIAGVLITNIIGGDPLRYLLGIFNIWAAMRMFKKGFTKKNPKEISWHEDARYAGRMPLKIKLFLFGLGIVVGISSSMLGIGGGVFIVAGLIAVLHYKPLKAVGTSAFIALLAGIIGSIFRMTLSNKPLEAPEMTYGTLILPLALAVGIPAIFGAQVGAYAHNKMGESKFFYISFGIILVAVTFKMIFV